MNILKIKIHFGFCVPVIAFLFCTSPSISQDGEVNLRAKIRGAIFGFACAEVAATPERPTPKRVLSTSEVGGLVNFGKCLVKNGGLAPEKAKSVIGPTRATSGAGPESALIEASRKILGAAGRGPESFARLLQTVPATIAYCTSDVEQALMCAEISAASDVPGDKKLRSSARAFATVFLGCLNGDYNKIEILERSEKNCGNVQMAELLSRVRTDQPLDKITTDPAEELALVLRAWLNGKSYADAMFRLGKNSTPTRRALLGALAGAEFEARSINKAYWPDLYSARILEDLSYRLHDLAADGILLHVDYSAFSKFRNTSSPRAGNPPLPEFIPSGTEDKSIETLPPLPDIEDLPQLTAPKVPAIPSISAPPLPAMPKAPNVTRPSIPTIPEMPKINQPKIPTAADFPLFAAPKSKEKTKQSSSTDN